ncbi:helicase-related protein [Spiroplasma endosymbiont of Virgichneumon dumeticola]|uniref:helicase-related protein n=1 Tax=Spiroplasma endosymbiont of Virgichneumon dumeticola TaxID=3139323 RepID=UPI0035C93C40
MRKQVDVRDEMPTIMKNDLILTMPKEQMNLYHETFEGMKEDLFYNKKTKITFLQIFTKLRTICSTPINEGMKELGAKFDWVLDYSTDNETDSVIIYSTFSDKGIHILSEILTKHKLKHQVMTGKNTQDQRVKAINDFQNGAVKIILCNIKTANVGVTLDKGDVMIFLDRELNPTENEQAESRFFPTQLNDNKPRQIINGLLPTFLN